MSSPPTPALVSVPPFPLHPDRAATYPLHTLYLFLPQTRTSSEPHFKVLSGDLIKSASTSYLCVYRKIKSCEVVFN